MKKLFKISALATAMVLAAGCQEKAAQAPAEVIVELNTDDQKAAYAIGASLGDFAIQTLAQQDEFGVVLDRETVKAGIVDALAGKSKMDEAAMTTALKAHEQRMTTAVQEQSKKKLEATKKASTDYLAANAEKEGVTTTKSGLQYQVVTKGTGPMPTADDTVTVHYTGKLTDGTVFDSSVERGEPATFPLANVIKGWTEGVALMPVGSKYTFTIPAELAYGDQDLGTIPAGSTLVFDVELLSIAPKEDAKPAAKAKTPARG